MPTNQTHKASSYSEETSPTGWQIPAAIQTSCGSVDSSMAKQVPTRLQRMAMSEHFAEGQSQPLAYPDEDHQGTFADVSNRPR